MKNVPSLVKFVIILMKRLLLCKNLDKHPDKVHANIPAHITHTRKGAAHILLLMIDTFTGSYIIALHLLMHLTPAEPPPKHIFTHTHIPPTSTCTHIET